MHIRIWYLACLLLALSGCAVSPVRGTNDLGVVIERETGSVQIINCTNQSSLGKVTGLGDLSHASVVFSRDGRFAYVFGRDGGLTKVDLLLRHIVKRILQAGNSIGGAISQDGRYVAAQNYIPGGVKIFNAATLALVADIPAAFGNGQLSKVVGLADAPGNKFVFSLFDAGEIWVADITDPAAISIEKFPAGKQPYDGLITPDGRYYISGLFGEDGLALLDLWHTELGTKRILDGYGRGEEKLPVYKMPHLRGWAVAGTHAYLPSIGHHEILVVDTQNWQQIEKIPVAGQPVFAIARPDGRQVWVSFAFPDNGLVQVLDTETNKVVKTLEPGRAVLHLEFTPRGEAVWISSRDDNKIVVYDTASAETLKELPAAAPSGIFFTNRAGKIGF